MQNKTTDYNGCTYIKTILFRANLLIPDTIDVKNIAERERFSCQCFWESSENKLGLHSYVFPTKSSGHRNVLLLSTVELIRGVTIDDGKKKPALCKLYDFTKAGTDVMEYRIGA